MKKFALTAIAAAAISMNAIADSYPGFAIEDMDVNLEVSNYFSVTGIPDSIPIGDNNIAEFNFTVSGTADTYNVSIISTNTIGGSTASKPEFGLFKKEGFLENAGNNPFIPMKVFYVANGTDTQLEKLDILNYPIEDSTNNAGIRLEVEQTDIDSSPAGNYWTQLNMAFAAQ